jgi:3-(3-hydroxy-phenyl)propionate hydroxylase
VSPEREFPTFLPPPGAEPRVPVAIVGAGPVGLTMALDLAWRGVPSVLVDDNNTVATGSRAICWAKRTLEIFDRLGVAAPMVERGVTWKVGRVHHRDREIFSFDLLPEPGHKLPAFINLQQYAVEEQLIARAIEQPGIQLRFGNRVIGLERHDDHAVLGIETDAGNYTLEGRYVIACDGCRSTVRGLLGLDFDGELFEERFLIADIEMQADYPPERQFWFEPPFHNGQSALLHKQPDDIWRIDLQLGWDVDPDVERRPENILPRIRRVVGDRPFRLDWTSIYTFQCRRLRSFVHGPVIFAGDSAHVVSPFGARGGNSGIQDVDNLGWKLTAVLAGEAPPALLATYDAERTAAADENLRHSSRATRFMSPAPGIERLFRDQVLALAATSPFARAWINSGRLSTPCTYPLAAPDDPSLPVATRPGAPAPDAPLGDGWLVDRLGRGFTLLAFGLEPPELAGVETLSLAADGPLRERYLDDAPHALYLVRPDRHIAARWTSTSAPAIAAAHARALCRTDG